MQKNAIIVALCGLQPKVKPPGRQHFEFCDRVKAMLPLSGNVL